MKEKIIYVCGECGYESSKWLGRCPNCGKWNSFVEEIRGRKKYMEKTAEPTRINEIVIPEIIRIKSGISEFDRVVGNGIVKGSLILIAGEPGVGKSTLLISVGAKISQQGKTVLYVSGEESSSQTKIRAERLSISSDNLYILSTTQIPAIKESINKIQPEILIIDSIQAIYDPEIPTTPGTVTQIRENTNFFMNFSKATNTAVFLVGHITKEGSIAGPKILEHIVDVVLYFEGEPRSNLRILRAIKNRFGSTMEIGVFSMEEDGLKEIPDAGALFLKDYHQNLPGQTIFPAQQGTRTLLVEIQALVAPTYYGIPKRSVIGLDYNRVSLILAVLEKKLHFNFGTHDVYVNAGGGIKIDEPASDLPVSIACVSSLKDVPPLEGSILIGEISLTGEIRPVKLINKRLKEAERLGFKKAIIPKVNSQEITKTSLQIFPVRWLKEAIEVSLPP